MALQRMESELRLAEQAFDQFLQENDHIRNRTDENSCDDILNASMSNFTQNTIQSLVQTLIKLDFMFIFLICNINVNTI